MTKEWLRRDLVSAFGVDRVRERAWLAPLTTLRVGGPADCLVEVCGVEEVVRAVTSAHAVRVPVTLLGGGSNVLVGDRGVRGLVVRVRRGKIRHLSPGLVRADAGASVNGLVRWTINRGLAGLETWAGTPGTVGGAVHGNAHFDGRRVGDLVDSVGLAARSGPVRQITGREMEFGYDCSRLRRTSEILLWADFRVTESEETAQLRQAARRSLAYRKRTQPLAAPSAGCVFQNPDPSRDRLASGMLASAGALIDRVGLKGRRVGQACVSQIHGNFIVNEGGATARDIRALVELCKVEVAKQCGVDLREEIVYLGEF